MDHEQAASGFFGCKGLFFAVVSCSNEGFPHSRRMYFAPTCQLELELHNIPLMSLMSTRGCSLILNDCIRSMNICQRI
jgi:hypothetical protein